MPNLSVASQVRKTVSAKPVVHLRFLVPKSTFRHLLPLLAHPTHKTVDQHTKRWIHGGVAYIYIYIILDTIWEFPRIAFPNIDPKW